MSPRFPLVAKAIDASLNQLGYGAGAALADLCEVGPATVHFWRTGARLPRPHRWATIEAFLQMPPGTIAELIREES